MIFSMRNVIKHLQGKGFDLNPNCQDRLMVLHVNEGICPIKPYSENSPELCTCPCLEMLTMGVCDYDVFVPQKEKGEDDSLTESHLPDEIQLGLNRAIGYKKLSEQVLSRVLVDASYYGLAAAQQAREYYLDQLQDMYTAYTRRGEDHEVD